MFIATEAFPANDTVEADTEGSFSSRVVSLNLGSIFIGGFDLCFTWIRSICECRGFACFFLLFKDMLA